MNETATVDHLPSSTVETFDVLIVGAGISGIGAAYHLQQQCPGTSFAVLEALESFGGTWWTHKYPGIRSDSDLYTFGYRFKPWVGPPIAAGDKILRYLGEVIEENDLAHHFRYRHRILKAGWSDDDKAWSIEALRTDTNELVRFRANFLWMCQGYYKQSQGYTPKWPGMSDYTGAIFHPETWPSDCDLNGKKVLVIGSGATAATLVPAISDDVEHVTVLQRSPTYFFPGRNFNELADMLRKLEIDESWIHEIVRRKILFEQAEFTRRAMEEPEVVKAELLGLARAFVGDETVEAHFTPKYRPWQQRLALVPDGDLFQAIVKGKASMVTDEIDHFTADGVKLKSGQELKADVIVTATEFNLNVLGDIEFKVNGKLLDFSKSVTYRGMMFTGLPNLLWIFGYFRASWTLRVDILCDFVCRLLHHVKAKGSRKVEVAIPHEDEDMELLPWIDTENFNPGYMMRSLHLLPKRGSKPKWAHTQDYWRERKEIPEIDLDAEEFRYS
jgi:cation diffusion facilitator CzcD-associated flavoprotein CzcO